MKLIAKILLWILKLRYLCEVRSALKEKDLDPEKGTLFLPNHVALIDPVFFFLLFWPSFHPRPLVLEFVAHIPFFRSFLRFVKGIEIPDFDNSLNPLKVHKANRALQTIAEGLKQKERFVVYPGARLKAEGKQQLFGASGIHTLLQACPDVQIVLVRMTGFWGSSFSRALEGKTPDLGNVVKKGMLALLKSAFFFLPRRRLIFETELNPTDFPRRGDRSQINRYLENWYNRYPTPDGKRLESEPLQLVAYTPFSGPPIPVSQKQQKKEENLTLPISDPLREEIYKLLRSIAQNEKLPITPNSSLTKDLGFDSLNMADLSIRILARYKIENSQLESMETVEDLLQAISAPSGKASERVEGVYTFPEEKNRPHPRPALGKTIPSSFLIACDEFSSYSACGDDLLGPITYKKMKRAVLVLSRLFGAWPEERIAVLLPSSVGALLTTLAIQCAGKVPVMLNWTLGPRYLEEMMKISGASRVVSSWRFLDRAANIDFGSLIDQFVLLEDLKRELSLKDKLFALFLSFLPEKLLSSWLKLDQISPDHPAVILFTSGTENKPKGVPLSHTNILQNIPGTFEHAGLTVADTIFNSLPLFHSFGFTSISYAIFLSGVKVVFFPDPTNSASIAEAVHRWKPSVFPAPPSFLSRLIQAAAPGDLSSVRLFISGAEKLGDTLKKEILSLSHHPKLVEGYGVTECSPIIATQFFDCPIEQQKGVGTLFSSYSVCTIHPETQKLLPEGAEGEICVKGPCVFQGYLGDSPSPFIQIQGEPWYRTGDIGFLEKDRTLHISGRLKRFTKIGGEMISLSAAEEALVKGWSQSHGPLEKPTFAICSDERGEAGAQLVLFSTIPIEKTEANELIHKAGLSNLIKISRILSIPEIPLFATGKVNHRALQEKIFS